MCGYEFCEIFKNKFFIEQIFTNTYMEEHLRMAASKLPH